MAEARLAVAFQFAVTDDGVQIDLNTEAAKLVAAAITNSVKQRIRSFVSGIQKGVYPATPMSWLVVLLAFISGSFLRPDLSQTFFDGLCLGTHWSNSTIYTKLVWILALTTLVWCLKSFILQYTLRKLLEWRSPMFTSSKPDWKVKIWGGAFGLVGFITGPMAVKNMAYPMVCGLMEVGTNLLNCHWMFLVRQLLGQNYKLYSLQKCLPCLSVPSLDDTISRYLLSVRPLLSDEEYNKMKKLAEEFKSGVAPRLQRYLVLKSWFAPNFVSDWWEQFVYLRSRSPIMINSNYYTTDVLIPPTTVQMSRAGNIIFCLVRFRAMIESSELKPVFIGPYPLCSMQYERAFNTTRIPGKEQDVTQHLGTSNYIVVMYRGRYYRMDIISGGVPLSPVEIERQVEYILHHAPAIEPCPGEEQLAALTSEKRSTWYEARSKFFSSGINQASLNIIEKAAFVLALEDTNACHSEEDPESTNNYCKALMHGNGYNRWFDKSFTLVIFKNGHIGTNTEHSWADAPVLCQIFEWVLIEDSITIGYTPDGRCKGTPRAEPLPLPSKLMWDIPKEGLHTIETAVLNAQKFISDIDLHLLIHSAFGKGRVKKSKVSPDAFIQIALQLAYYRDIGRFNLTYEAAMTRFFRNGRTETLRSCTMDSCNFVRAMDDSSVPIEKKVKLFRIAANTHFNMIKYAAIGQGVDRHLFCLYVVSKYLQLDVDFLKEVLSDPWRLSTSQTPIGMSGRDYPKDQPGLTTTGGGFGPVADDGYGVSYIIFGEDVISFHVSSKISCPLTNSGRFAMNIRRAMREIIEMLEIKSSQ